MKGSKCKCAGREAGEIIGSLQSEKDMKAWAAGEAGLPPRSASVQKQGSKEVRRSHREAYRPQPASQAQPWDPLQLGQLSSFFSVPQFFCL